MGGMFSLKNRAGSGVQTVRMPVALVVGAGIFVSVIGAQTIQGIEDRRDHAAFELVFEQVVNAVEDRVSQQIQLVQSIVSFFHSSQAVERGEFTTFVADALKRYDAIQAVGWVPRVAAADRSGIEAAARRDGFADFQVHQRTEDGRPASVAARAEYYPTLFVEPRAADETSLGYDQASQPVQLAAMQRARDGGQIALSGRVELLLADEDRSGVIAYAPVYLHKSVPPTVDERRRNLAGFAFGHVRPARIMDASIKALPTAMSRQLPEISIDIFDTTDAANPNHLLSYLSSKADGAVQTAAERRAQPGDFVRAAEFGGRQWTFVARRAVQPVGMAWQAWTTLVALLALTTILAAYLHTILNRARAIESEVGLRTNELKLTNDLLRASEDRIRAIADSVPAMIAYVDHDLIYRFANRRYHEIGLDPEEMIGKSMLEVRGDADYAEVRSYFERAALGDAVSFEISSVDRNGRSHFHAIECQPDIAHGQVKGFYVLARDVTEQRRMEQELDEFFAQSLTLMCVINFDGYFSRFNPNWKVALGYDYDELISTKFSELAHVDDREKVRAALESLVAGGEVINLELRFLRKDGAERSILWNATYDRHGLQIYATGHDITALKAVDRMKDEFVATVSHELRTPLTSIKGALGLIRAKTMNILPPDMVAMLDIAYRNCERLVLLINDILDIEKIEAGKMDFAMRPLDIVPVVEHAIVANTAYAHQFGVRLVLAKKVDGSLISGNEDRLMQVLTNLLSNAAKFSPTDGTVEIRVERHAGNVRISVSDCGVGIPEEYRGRIFQKFSQVDSTDRRKVGGTGLGLSIVRAIVERHGGVVDYICKPGTGTTFFVDLPEIQPKPHDTSRVRIAAK